MNGLVRDILYTLRQLRKAPSFALTTILTLTLTIAANVVVFGVVNALILHPLPVAHPEQVFQVQGSGTNDLTISYPNYADIRDRNTTFSDVAIFRLMRIGLQSAGAAQPIWGYEASGNYFDMLGVRPAIGQFFHPADDVKVNGSQVAVLSYTCWQSRFGGDPGIVGKTVLVNKLPFTVLGVAPMNFSGTEKFLWPEIWVPYHDLPEIEASTALEQRNSNNAWVVGRLKPGVTSAQADADLAHVAATLKRDYPKEDAHLSPRVAKPGMLGDAMSQPIQAFLTGVMLLALLVLLAACANLGGMFAARTADRARELGIRIAIGSTRWMIVRQLLTESVTIALIGGGVAAAIARMLLNVLNRWQPANLEIPVQFFAAPDVRIYFFAVLLALVTGLLFGLIPVRQIWKTDPNETLKASGNASYKESRFSVRSILLAVQIALCCLLVTSAAVAFRGLQRTLTAPLGIQPEHVVLATMDPLMGGYKGKEIGVVQQRMMHALAAIPGVSGVAYANSTPLSVDQSNSAIWAPGTTDFSMANAKFYAINKDVSEDYFKVAGTHMLFGRAFTEHDDADAPPVVVVNATFAQKLFGTVNAVGKTFPWGAKQVITVVGVVENGKYDDLTESPMAAFFRPMQQQPDNDTVLLIRSDRSTDELIPAIQRTIASVDAGIPVMHVYSWTDALSLVTFPARAATAALGVLGLLAILLAITGIFGQANYTVSRRMRELGIRVALGAQGREVLRAALGRIGLLLGIGSVAGLLLGVGASKLLASIVYQATAADPIVIVAAAIIMAALGMLSALIPARRALHVNPAILLRDQ